MERIVARGRLNGMAIENARAGFDYVILEEIEAGLELHGFEVKSLRAGHGSLKGARVVARGGEAYLVGATVPPWQILNAPKSYDPERPRRLLLSQKEIAHVASAEGEKGLTIIPLKVYNKGRNLKLLIAIARGKKKEDKRQSIRAREEKRSINRTLKTK
jgi:SsrA-binding protein